MRALALLALIVVGCGPPTPTPAPALVPGQRITVAPLPTTIKARPAAGVPIARATFLPVVTPSPTPDVASGGLGLRRRDWETRGSPLSLTPEFRDDRVVALTNPPSRIGSSASLYTFSIDNARGQVRLVVPRDAVYLGTDLGHRVTVDRFDSATVGPFTATYSLDEETRVVSYRVALGET